MVDKLVSRSNEMITSRFAFSMNEYRIFLYGLSLINPLAPDFPLAYKINVKIFAEMFGITTVDSLYGELKETVINKLFKRSMTINLEGGIKRLAHVVRHIDYHDSLGELTIVFDEEIKPFVYDLKDRFTSYSLEQVSHFKSIYSLRFYEFAIMNLKANNGKPTQFFISIDELKRRFEITEKYKLYSNFKRRVLEKAMTEINAFSNVSLRYLEIKKGRSVDQIKLIVKYKNWEKKEHQHTINFDPDLVIEK